MPPWSFWDCFWLAPAALILDLALGDPPLPWPHPVCLAGWLLHFMETPCRRYMDKGSAAASIKRRGRLPGALALALCCLIIGASVFVLISIPFIGWLFALYFSWAGLAMGCLLSTGREVLNAIEHSPLPEARHRMAWLVSRDVSLMDRKTLLKTLADTLSENFTDAFMAPFFWLCLTGPAGLWIYKTVSTADSQWGYLTPEWRNIGFAAARSDDALAWAPARLSALFLYLTDKLAALFAKGRIWQGAWPGWKTLAKDAGGMPSPNSGWSMAACAWLCGASMAGPSVYFGQLVVKPWIGPVGKPWTAPLIGTLNALMFGAALTGGAVFCIFLYFCQWIIRLSWA